MVTKCVCIESAVICTHKLGCCGFMYVYIYLYIISHSFSVIFCLSSGWAGLAEDCDQRLQRRKWQQVQPGAGGGLHVRRSHRPQRLPLDELRVTQCCCLPIIVVKGNFYMLVQKQKGIKKIKCFFFLHIFLKNYAELWRFAVVEIFCRLKFWDLNDF